MEKMNKFISIFIIIILLATAVLGFKVAGDMLVTGTVQTEKVIFEQDTTNHMIYDDTTCIIIKGDTSELTIC